MAKITVVVTAYNEEKYLLECLESIENQTYKDIKIIIVNDGSTDKTLEIANSFKEKSKIPVEIIDQKNQGVSAARNNAIERVDTKYVKFVDGDDFMEPNALEEMIKIAIKYNVPIVRTSYQTIELDGSKKTNSFNLNKDKEDTVIDISKNKDWICFASTGIGEKLYETECFNDIKFPKFERKYVPEDLAIMPLIFAKSKKIGIAKPNLMNYRRHPGSLTVDKLRKVCTYYLDSLQSIDYLINLFKEHCLYDEYKEQLAKLELEYREVDAFSLKYSKQYTYKERKLIYRYIQTLAYNRLKELEYNHSIYKNKFIWYWPIISRLAIILIKIANLNMSTETIKTNLEKVLLKENK